jgi:TonB family protein
MKTFKLLLGATLMGGLLSTSAFAYKEQPTPWPQAARVDIPTVAKVVKPTNLPANLAGSIVTLSFTIDAMGHPQSIKVVSPRNVNLKDSLLPAFAQWRFAPAQKAGLPASTRVELPLKLIAEG